MYADNTCLVACAYGPEALELQLNNDLKRVPIWLQASHNLNHDFEIKVNDQVLNRVHSYRYLGIGVNEILNYGSRKGQSKNVSQSNPKIFYSNPKMFFKFQNIVFKSENILSKSKYVFHIRKCFSNPKMSRSYYR